MSDFTLSPPTLAAILCNAPPPPLIFQPPLPIIIAQSLTLKLVKHLLTVNATNK